MSRSIVLAASFVSFAAFAGSATAQSALSSCNPATGLTPGGAPCVELTPIDPNAIGNTPVGAAGGEKYGRLDTTTLGQTYACRTATANDRRVNTGGALLIEDCGAPLSSGELGPLKPFFGTTGTPAPLPVAAAPLPPAPLPAALPPVTLPPAPVVAAAPAFAPVAASGLGGSIIPLALGAAGLAAVVGIAIAVDDDDDNDSTNGS